MSYERLFSSSSFLSLSLSGHSETHYRAHCLQSDQPDTYVSPSFIQIIKRERERKKHIYVHFRWRTPFHIW